MKMRTIGVMTAGLLVTALSAGSAAAQCPPTNPPSSVMIEFDANCFAYETNYDVNTSISSAGSILTIVGIIDQFYAPLGFLNPADPTREYTFVVKDLVSAGTLTSFNGPTTIYDTNYSGGTFVIYEGSPENAPLAGQMGSNPSNGPTVPENFEDGTPILTGELCGFATQVTKTQLGPSFVWGGSFGATYHFTNPNAPNAPPAGNLFNLVGDAQAVFTGLWCAQPGTGCTPATYSAHPNGKWDSPPTTPAMKSTWGTLKQLYR